MILTKGTNKITIEFDYTDSRDEAKMVECKIDEVFSLINLLRRKVEK